MIKFDKKIRLKYQSLCGIEGYDELRFMRLVCQTSVEDSRALYDGYEDRLQYAIVGATIGTYSGPGAIALAYFEKD